MEASRIEQSPSRRCEPRALNRGEHGEMRVGDRRVERFENPVREAQHGRGVNGAVKPLPTPAEPPHLGVVARQGQRHEDRERKPSCEQARFERFGDDSGQVTKPQHVDTGVQRRVAECCDA